MMKKRVLSLALMLVFVLALVPAASAAANIGYVEIVPLIYDGMYLFSDGMAAVYIGEMWSNDIRWGFIDTTGREIVPLGKYDGISSFSDGIAMVWLDGILRLIDTTGREIVQLDKYDWARPFSEGMAAVGLNGKYGFIDKTGKEIVPLKYDIVWRFSDGLAVVGVGHFHFNDIRWGFIDNTGREVVPLGKYDAVGYFVNGMAGVAIGVGPNQKWGFIDINGKEVIPPMFDGMVPFSDGLAAVWLDGKVGFIDTTGNVVIPFGKYDDVLFDEGVALFSDGLAAVMLDGKKGFIDTTGSVVVPFGKYEGVALFSDGLAAVWLDDKVGFIDTAGNVAIPFVRYDNLWYIEPFIEGYATIILDGQMGVIDRTGRMVVPFGIYDYIGPFRYGVAEVEKNNKMGVIVLTDDAPPLFSDIGTITGEQLENILFVAGEGLFEGSGGRFMPFEYIRNAEFIAVLSRLGKSGVTDGTPWYQPYADWAEGFGIFGAGDFDPDAFLTREDMALWFYRFIVISGMEPEPVRGGHAFTDIGGLSEEVREAIAAMYDWDIIRGSSPGEVFGTGGNSERVHIANVLARFLR